jgi:Flp pilus assembly protein TadD
MTIQQAIDTAIAQQRSGHFREAELIYRQILAQEPNHPQAMHLIGLLAYDAKNYELAEQLMLRAISLDDTRAQFHGNLGLVLTARGRKAAAIESFRRAIAIQPDYAQAYNNIGFILFGEKQVDEAIVHYRKAISLQPDSADAINNLGNALAYRGDSNEAIEWYRRVIQLCPQESEARNNLAGALVSAGQPEQAIPQLQHAIALFPDYLEARMNLALTFLMVGDLKRGFAEYEARRLRPPIARPDLPQTMWDGSEMSGKCILLHAEQGIGDTIHFLRYVPMVKAQGGRIILQCDKQLHPLLNSFEGIEQFIARNDPLPQFDAHCPLLSLPFVFKTNSKTIPLNLPYIHAEEGLLNHWRLCLAGDQKFKVGLVWAGGSEFKNDRIRSMGLSVLASLANVANVSLYSLQKGKASEQALNPPAGMKLIDFTPELNNFAHTAALVANLDLVISVDTAVAHLAGAMAKPVWTMLPFAPDWRWMLNRNDSPWYPTMRLFRQQKHGDWSAPAEQMRQALIGLTKTRIE